MDEGPKAEEAVQHGGSEQRPRACPTCQGSGKVYLEISSELRKEYLCGSCHGSGLWSDALASKLSGTEDEQLCTDAEKRRVISRVQSGWF